MPLAQYGVLAAAAVGSRREGAAQTPHYQIQLRDAGGGSYRAAVNVKSQQSPSELLYLADDNFSHPILELLPDAGTGWTRLPSRLGGPNLDFIRGNLFDPARMRKLPPDAQGPDNDLADLLDHYVQRAIGDARAILYVFGERWGPETGVADKIFGFKPGNGVHDVHMNQGNSGAFTRDDGVRQDGGLLLHFPGESRWVAVFLAFQSQAWHTDDATGHTIPSAQHRLAPEGPAVRILAAPAGTVLLMNASAEPVDLTGWQLADRLQRTCPVPGGLLAAGRTLPVGLGDGVRLEDRGGTLTLLDAQGLKVDGVAYTAGQAGREGWSIIF